MDGGGTGPAQLRAIQKCSAKLITSFNGLLLLFVTTYIGTMGIMERRMESIITGYIGILRSWVPSAMKFEIRTQQQETTVTTGHCFQGGWGDGYALDPQGEGVY